MSKYKLDLKAYSQIARQAAAEGCVLLKNDKKTLPLRQGDRISVFGRSAFHYYNAGLGSGGLVNTRYVVGILEALRQVDTIELNDDLIKIYEKWLEENPFDEGQGWGKVPWSQKEMPLTQTLIEDAREKSDVALVIIGRTAGEDQDAKDEAGSYRLTALEEAMIESVSGVFDRTVVVFNVGNVLDMTWVKKYEPGAILYGWQGGQEGGHGLVDILTGKVTPCGKLTDTIADAIEDYPSTANFGDKDQNIYAEDIYVGYRYFETFAKDQVLYPFGYGLSYTDFDIQSENLVDTGSAITLKVKVTNTGDYVGKEVVQLYLQAPQGLLGKPSRVLVAYYKTKTLDIGESQTFTLAVDKKGLASYDDSGVTGYKSSYVIEEGAYVFYLGRDVRSAWLIGSIEEDFSVVETLEEAYAPVKAFSRMKAMVSENDQLIVGYEQTPLRSVDLEERIKARRPEALSFTGNKGYRLGDVYDQKISLDAFVAQLTDEEMACLIRGEGMCSPKATPGVAAAFGGVTSELAAYGIPVACCADGPSGIRMDCGTKAFSLPNGTALGCTYNDALIEELFVLLGRELRKNKIDTILGPGINIHRHPLNGRNFEYITEDPYLNGKVTAAQLRGMHEAGVTGTIKHFVANNQETGRRSADAIISERALREIYLKGFEMAVKEGGAYAIMTTYGPVNGLWTAGSYDLNTTILRKEWGFKGLVMTDWWAEANFEGESSKRGNTAPMLRAQNDLYMVVRDSLENPENDNTLSMIEEGYISRGDLQRSAKNILDFILRSPVMPRYLGRVSTEELEEMDDRQEDGPDISQLKYYDIIDGNLHLDFGGIEIHQGHEEFFGLNVTDYGLYDITITYKSDLNPLAQLNTSVFINNQFGFSFPLRGTEGVVTQVTEQDKAIFGPHHYIKIFFAKTGLTVYSVDIKFVKAYNPFE